MPIEMTPLNPTPVSYIPPNSQRYQLSRGESWKSIAQQYNLKPWELVEFNFPSIKQTLNVQKKRAELNWYLNHYVGCMATTADGRNWLFSDRIQAGKRGYIYVPWKNNPTQMLAKWLSSGEFSNMPHNQQAFQCLLYKLLHPSINDEFISPIDYHNSMTVTKTAQVSTTKNGKLRNNLFSKVPNWDDGSGNLNVQQAWWDLESVFWKVVIPLQVALEIKEQATTSIPGYLVYNKIEQLARQPNSLYYDIINQGNCFGKMVLDPDTMDNHWRTWEWDYQFSYASFFNQKSQWAIK